jgi:hypothetical protein
MSHFLDDSGGLLLNDDVHGPLLKNIAEYCSMAGIPERLIYQSASNFLTDKQYQTFSQIKTFPERGLAGVVLYGNLQKPVEDIMGIITAVCLRNYIDARLMTVKKILDILKQSTEFSPSVILIPNFFISKLQGGHQADWDISTLLGFLMDRYNSGKITIVYVSSLINLRQEYGVAFYDHLTNHYIQQG